MRKLLVLLIKWGFPLLLVTDLSSSLLNSEMLLNSSRLMRSIMLMLFVIEYIRLFPIIRTFEFYRYFLIFLFILFCYLFTDPNFSEGLWIYFKILFWVLGIHILYAYAYLGILTYKNFLSVIKKVVWVSVFFTLLYKITGYIESDYNVAAYLVLFMYPLLLDSSEGFKKNKYYILLTFISVIITLKRGAIIALALGSFVYFIALLRGGFRFRKLILAMFFASFFLGVSGLAYNLSEKDDINERFSAEQFDLENEQAGSGRVGMYKNLFERWYYSDLDVMLFGHGNQADSHRTHGRRTHAHSDWLGFLYNYGLVGVSLIVLLYFKIIKFYISFRKYDRSASAALGSFFFILILVNFYSGLFRTTEVIFFFALLPYLQIRRDAYKKSSYIDEST